MTAEHCGHRASTCRPPLPCCSCHRAPATKADVALVLDAIEALGSGCHM